MQNISLNDNNFKFGFKCYKDLICFTSCCKDVDMDLYPYDIIRMKESIGISSEDFLHIYTIPEFIDDFYFPRVTMKMNDNEEKSCPFLTTKGCKIYKDRPFSCRMYPLECNISRGLKRKINYNLVKHNYCSGHNNTNEWTFKQWIKDQEVDVFIQMNKPWIDIDTIFRNNQWKFKKIHVPMYKLIFSACYNVDNFRDAIDEFLLPAFEINEQALIDAKKSDVHMMKFGFDCVKFFFTGKGPLTSRQGDVR